MGDSMADLTVTLSADELGEVLAVLESSHHGKEAGDYEPECPACTAAEKMKDAAGVALPDGGQTA